VGEDFDLRFTDVRGSDFRIRFTPQMRDNQLNTNRWRGRMTAEDPGCYVHYLPTHGPNLWDHNSVLNDFSAVVKMEGVLYPQGAVGFERPFAERIAVEFDGDTVSAVHGKSTEAGILREMLVGGRMIEGGGCGFNPKAPRHTVYPAGSNSPGALHFGIDLAKPSDYIRKVMPDWEEPPVHMDLVAFDATVAAGSNHAHRGRVPDGAARSGGRRGGRALRRPQGAARSDRVALSSLRRRSRHHRRSRHRHTRWRRSRHGRSCWRHRPSRRRNHRLRHRCRRHRQLRAAGARARSDPGRRSESHRRRSARDRA
jgi:hypothetical protein